MFNLCILSNHLSLFYSPLCILNHGLGRASAALETCIRQLNGVYTLYVYYQSFSAMLVAHFQQIITSE